MQAAIQGLQAGALDGMTDAVQHLKTSAQDLTPIEEGTLERSATATTATSGDLIQGAVSFHGPYAARQHEELSWRHDSGRQAKYLEQPMHTEADTMGRLIAASIQSRLQ
ncbi:hypothetical protein IEE94_11190 [Yimella sp. cx-573]|nr:hypothetical protein [Yimella sp. cx-573]